MAKINLLPWRQERREQRQKEFYGLLGACAVLGLLIAFAVVSYVGGLVENQQARNNYLTQEIQRLETKIKEIETLEKQRADLLQRKQVIEELQASRSQMVHLFDELVRTIPDGVRLNSIKQAGQRLTLMGIAQSNARVSSYMRALQQSGWITNPDLNIIEAKGEDRTMPYQFTLNVDLTQPKAAQSAEQSESALAAGGAP
ncbi:MAG: PilN domain-containing protein [Lysobacteraceae bacterium]